MVSVGPQVLPVVLPHRLNPAPRVYQGAGGEVEEAGGNAWYIYRGFYCGCQSMPLGNKATGC